MRACVVGECEKERRERGGGRISCGRLGFEVLYMTK